MSGAACEPPPPRKSEKLEFNYPPGASVLFRARVHTSRNAILYHAIKRPWHFLPRWPPLTSKMGHQVLKLKVALSFDGEYFGKVTHIPLIRIEQIDNVVSSLLSQDGLRERMKLGNDLLFAHGIAL